jgi:hypothetical protein
VQPAGDEHGQHHHTRGRTEHRVDSVHHRGQGLGAGRSGQVGQLARSGMRVRRTEHAVQQRAERGSPERTAESLEQPQRRGSDT